jgi:hypothetical protein
MYIRICDIISSISNQGKESGRSMFAANQDLVLILSITQIPDELSSSIGQ